MLQLNNVSYFYNKGTDNEAKALSNVSLTIEKGQFVSVIGPNGSGKSTLAYLLNGILKPGQGQVLIDGFSTADNENLLKIRQSVGLLFQNPDNQIIATIVEEDVAFGPENLGVKREEIIARVDKALEAVGMKAFRRYEPHMLSAGQKQKIAIASTLAMEPDYLVLDEPMSYLDPASRKEITIVLKQMNRKGKTVINITHFPDQIALGQRVIALDKGRIIFDGSRDTFFKNRKLIKELGVEIPLWMDVKSEFAGKIKQLENVQSVEELGKVICSSS